MIRSDSPPAYASALSKNVMPPSHAAAMQSRALPVSSWVPKDTHDPKERRLTFRPERPRRRCGMSLMPRTLPTALSAAT
jgi:hypothetical protein